MATTTNKAMSSHDQGPQARKTKIEEQGPEVKSVNKNPNRDKAADKAEQAEGAVTAFLEEAKTNPEQAAALSAHKSRIPDPGHVSPNDSAANIPVSEVAAGIEPPADEVAVDLPVSSSHSSNILGPDPAFGDPDSIAATTRRRAEEAKLKAKLDAEKDE